MRDPHKLHGVDGRDKPGHDEPTENGAFAEASVLTTTSVDDVVGMLCYDGLAKTIEEMDASVLAEAIRREQSGEEREWPGQARP
ncbi:hypothetical protein F7D13_02700 [Methylocystis rosea]|uniref:Uncharacterized protein n=1 Tax=Methylocystis rosea TaxID=173366 RepID=A0ABX6EDT0_9HYPH|nr:hypothetical protein [Methylocystis rosea]QGM93013.1 hypothetical protein F7D13_02700 [Methylocystis rosea]